MLLWTYAEYFRQMGVGKSHGHENLIHHPGRAGETEFVPDTNNMVRRVLPVPIGEKARRIDAADAHRQRDEFLKWRDQRAASAPRRPASAASIKRAARRAAAADASTETSP
jgi:hypothetical protein